MKRFLIIMASMLFWAAVVCYMVWSSDLGNRRRNSVVVREMKITITDSARLGLVTPTMVEGWIRQEGLWPVGKSVGEVDAGGLRRAVMGHGSASSAVVYLDMEGTAHVSLAQHTPVARVIVGEYDFMLMSGGHILPREGYAPQYLPVVTGNLRLPFEAGFTGDLHRLAEVEEKKSYKNYIFLCKLINFAEYIGANEFWRSQIVQIDVSDTSRQGGNVFRHAENAEINGAADGNGNLFADSNDDRPQERGGNGHGEGGIEQPESMPFGGPEVELIPRAGDHVIEFGNLDDFAKKLDNLRLFYEQAAAVEGWNKWNRISLKYEDQIVCK